MKYCFGVDIGGTTIKMGIFKFDGESVDKWPHQGKLVHRVRPFDITARSPYQSMYHFLSRRYIIKQIMAIARKNNRTARSSLNLHLA